MYIHVSQSFDASGSSDVQVCTLIIQISAWDAYLILDFFRGVAYSRGVLIQGRVLIKFSPFLPQRHSNLEQIYWYMYLPLHNKVQHDELSNKTFLNKF